jgi:lysozyme
VVSPSRAIVALSPALLACVAAACSGGSTSNGACVASGESALVVEACAGGATVQGVDVSVYQGRIDWAQVKAAGIGFAFARVSDGTGYPDTEFAANWPGMKAAGVVRGAYQFFRPEEDPTAQANLFVSMLASAGGLTAGDLPPVMDLEVTDSTSDATIQAHMQAWFAAMQAATGLKPILYMSPSFASHAGSGFTGYPLWVANWDVACPAVPAGWATWTFWQKSDMGMVQGIPNVVDLDEFNGSPSQLPVLGGAPSGGDAGIDAGAEDAATPPPDDAGPVGRDAGAVLGDAGAVVGGGSAHDAGLGPQSGSAAGGGPCR